MAHLTGTARAQYVQGMFTRIASRYDLMNRLMTFGQDRRWRREVIKRAQLPQKKSLLLDLGGGTGDLGLEAIRGHPSTIPIETDFTLEMMRVGQERPGPSAALLDPQLGREPRTYRCSPLEAAAALAAGWAAECPPAAA